MAVLRVRFMRRAEGDAVLVRAAIEAGDHAELRRLCHGLAGSAGMFGFAETGRLAQAVEEAVDRNAGRDELDALTAALLEGLDRLDQDC